MRNHRSKGKINCKIYRSKTVRRHGFGDRMILQRTIRRLGRFGDEPYKCKSTANLNKYLVDHGVRRILRRTKYR